MDDNALAELRTGIEREMDQRFAENQRAVEAAMAALNKRLDGMNEFRSAMKDREVSFIARTEFAAAIGGLREQIAALGDRTTRSEGTLAGSTMTRGALFAALAGIGVVVGVVATLIKLWRP